jgi:Tol biopolymer transport system component
MMYAVIAAACALANAACAEPIAGPDTGPEEQLLFLSTRDGALDDLGRPMLDIYRMNADGSDVVNLTRQPSFNYIHLSVSPDGHRIVFSSDRAGSGIWIMNTDGANLTRLTGRGPGEGSSASPRWSPDGTRIAFTSNREQGQVGGGLHRRVYVVNADDTGLMPLFERMGDHSPGTNFSASFNGWSASGAMIALTRRLPSTAPDIFVINADGSNLRDLTNSPSEDTDALWVH